MVDDDDPLLGRTLGGKYRLEMLIGRGGFGAVYRATQHPLGHEVAVKVLMRNDGPGRGAMRDRFFREGRSLTRLRGRACVVMHDFGEEPDGLLYMVQELLNGRTLTRALADGDRFPPARIARVGGEILDALDEAHALGIVHRDIKPDNVMLVAGRNGEEVRVLDFGIAKVLDPGDDPEGGTSTGHLIGTPVYMAPEQALQRSIGPAADQYALGIVLYQLAVGDVPFKGRSTFEILRHHVDTAPPRLDRVTPALRAVIGRALAKDPADRYVSAREMRTALLAAGEADGAHASRPGTPSGTAPTMATDETVGATGGLVSGTDETVGATGVLVSGTDETVGATAAGLAPPGPAAVGNTTDETHGVIETSTAPGPITTVGFTTPSAGFPWGSVLAVLALVGLGGAAWWFTRPPTGVPVGVVSADGETVQISGGPSGPKPPKVGVGVPVPAAGTSGIGVGVPVPAAGTSGIGVGRPGEAPDAPTADRMVVEVPRGVAVAAPAGGVGVKVPAGSVGVKVDGPRYRARLSARDHRNSRGTPLKTAADVIRQDRANVHRYGVRDADDELDDLYGDKARRAAMRGQLLDLDPDVARRIMQGTPLVEVSTTPSGVVVRIVD